jgi:hypothetical protein
VYCADGEAGGGRSSSGEGASGSGRERLGALLGGIADATGREDVRALLRDRLLLRLAARAGCSKVLRGDSACATAARVVSDLAKGRGYSLPADIQLLDARALAAGRRPGPPARPPPALSLPPPLLRLPGCRRGPLPGLSGRSSPAAAA